MSFFKKPPHWREYFTSYPNGFSLMEMLSDWASKANILKKDLDNKTDKYGDHKGTWHGLKPSQANESIGSLVERMDDDLTEVKQETELIRSDLDSVKQEKDLIKGDLANVKNRVTSPTINKTFSEWANVFHWHDKGFMGEGVKVGIIDSPFSITHYRHDVFKGRVSEGLSYDSPLENFWYREYFPNTDLRNTHGNRVSNVIHNIVPKSDLFMLPVRLHDRSGGVYKKMINSFDWAWENGIKIINFSMAGTGIDQEVIQAEQLAHERKITLVTSAGNNASNGGENTLSAAASRAHWIAVGAAYLDNEGNVRRRPSSSYGENLFCLSNGQEVETIIFDGSVVSGLSGTSYSSGFVSGMLALWFERYYKFSGVYPTPQQARDFISQNSVKLAGQTGRDPYNGHGVFRLPQII